jgi:hypothetical protein
MFSMVVIEVATDDSVRAPTCELPGTRRGVRA